MAMFSQAVTAFITEQQASRFLEECLIGSALFDKHPEEMNFSPHGLAIPIVSSTKLVNISHIVFVWLCRIAVCPVGDCRTDFPDSLKINSRDKVSGFPPHLHFILMKSYPDCQQVCSICKS